MDKVYDSSASNMPTFSDGDDSERLNVTEGVRSMFDAE